MTSESKGHGTVALSIGESELYALGAMSVELILIQAILTEVGLSFLVHAKQTAAQHEQWQRNREKTHNSYSFKI